MMGVAGYAEETCRIAQVGSGQRGASPGAPRLIYWPVNFGRRSRGNSTKDKENKMLTEEERQEKLNNLYDKLDQDNLTKEERDQVSKGSPPLKEAFLLL
jgi:hypothetical protein